MEAINKPSSWKLNATLATMIILAICGVLVVTEYRQDRQESKGETRPKDVMAELKASNTDVVKKLEAVVKELGDIRNTINHQKELAISTEAKFEEFRRAASLDEKKFDEFRAEISELKNELRIQNGKKKSID